MPARAQLALREAVPDPEHAQKVPVAARHAEPGDAALEDALERAVGVANEITGAARRGQLRGALGSLRRFAS
jgi:hypothetical protein